MCGICICTVLSLLTCSEMSKLHVTATTKSSLCKRCRFKDNLLDKQKTGQKLWNMPNSRTQIDPVYLYILYNSLSLQWSKRHGLIEASE